jgi:hypothetical protein
VVIGYSCVYFLTAAQLPRHNTFLAKLLAHRAKVHVAFGQELVSGVQPIHESISISPVPNIS